MSLCLFVGGLAAAIATARDVDVGRKGTFDIAAGAALEALKQYSAQSNVPLLYAADDVDGVRTNPVRGDYSALEALMLMLRGTELFAVQDARSGALTVNRRPVPDRPKVFARPISTPIRRGNSSPEPTVADDPVRLPQFSVSARKANVYRPADTISGARIRGELVNTPLSIKVVTRELLEDLGANSVYEATRYFSGISNGRGAGAGGIMDRQNFRGFESFTKTIDNFSNQLIPGNSGFVSVFEPQFIERVEVVMGPDTILSPTGSPGGSMNIITKSPQFERATDLVLEAGNYQAGKLTIDSTGPLAAGSRWAYRTIADYQDATTYVPGGIGLWDLSAQLTWAPSDSTRLTVKYFGTQWKLRGAQANANDNGWLVIDPGSVRGATIAGTPPAATGFTYDGWNGNAAWSHTFDRMNLLSAQLTTVLAGQISMRLGLELLNDNNVGDSAYPSLAATETFDEATGEVVAISAVDATKVPIVARYNHGVNQQLQVQNDYAANFRFGDLSLQPVAGFAFQRGRTPTNVTRQNNQLPAANIFAGYYDPPRLPLDTYAFSQSSRANARQFQLYAFSKLGLFDDRLAVTSGISRTWVNSDTAVFDVADFSAPPARQFLSGFKDTYLGGVLLKPASFASLYYTYSSNAAITNSANRPLWQGGQQHEFGAKAEFFSQRLSLTAAHFQIAQTNLVTPNPAFNVDPARNPPSTLSNQTNHGFEFELVGGLTRRLSIIASYTAMKYRDPFGRRARNVPDHLANLLLSYRFDTGVMSGAGLFAGVVHMGGTAGENPPTTLTSLGVPKQPGFFIAPWTVYNAGASYRWDRFCFNLNVDNLINEKFVWQPSSRLSVSPYPGTTIHLTTTVKF